MRLIVLKNNVPLNEVLVETTDLREMNEIYVGRSEDCHVQIDDPLISRHHLVFKNDSTGWSCEKITQLGTISLNGVLVNKKPVKNGDEIKCGAYSILISGLVSADLEKVPPTLEDHDFQPIIKEERIEDLPEKENKELDQKIESAEIISVSDEVIDSFDEFSSFEENQPDQEPSDLNGNSSEDESLTYQSNEYLEQVEHEPDQSNDFSPKPDEDSVPFDISTTDNAANESTRFFKAFVNYQLVLFGEHAPYDRYQIDQDEIYIGRDTKKCQIVLNDPEVSTVHAVIRKKSNEITLEDLNSSNGTIVNGERINKADISAGDEFIIGGTSFVLEVKSDLLDSESERLMPVQSDQVVETEEIIEEDGTEDGEISFENDSAQEKSIIKRILRDPVKRKKVIYGAVVMAIIMLLLPEEEEVAAPKKPRAQTQKESSSKKPEKKISLELQKARNVAYELGVSYFEQDRFDLAQIEFQKAHNIDPDYLKLSSYLEQTNLSLKRLQELEEQRRAEEERIRIKKQVSDLIVKAREAVKEHQVTVAEMLFSQITEKDPENIEVSQLKLELESWQREEEKKALELAVREAARKKMVDALNPGKTFYLKKEWYRAILKLEEFLRLQGSDEDLIKEASDMLSESKNQLMSELGPLLGKARSLKEGQDFKSAYEAFLDILKVEPTNIEALNEVDDIKSQLDLRSRKIYREGIIAESLSLFVDAKEKFHEVQQISPTDSEYYKKASEKLKNYLE